MWSGGWQGSRSEWYTFIEIRFFDNWLCKKTKKALFDFWFSGRLYRPLLSLNFCLALLWCFSISTLEDHLKSFNWSSCRIWFFSKKSELYHSNKIFGFLPVTNMMNLTSGYSKPNLVMTRLLTSWHNNPLSKHSMAEIMSPPWPQLLMISQKLNLESTLEHLDNATSSKQTNFEFIIQTSK